MTFFARLSRVWDLYILLVLFYHARAAPSGFVQTRSTKFLLDGSPFLFNWFNSYWMMHAATESSERCYPKKNTKFEEKKNIKPNKNILQNKIENIKLDKYNE